MKLFQVSPEKRVSESDYSGPTGHKRPRIEPPKPNPDEASQELPTKPVPVTETNPGESSEKKKKWFNKQRGQGPKPPQQQQQLPPSQQPKLVLTTRKNRPADAGPNPGLHRPATNRFSPQGRGGRQGGQQQQPPRMAQVPSPWAVAPQAANPWFGKY